MLLMLGFLLGACAGSSVESTTTSSTSTTFASTTTTLPPTTTTTLPLAILSGTVTGPQSLPIEGAMVTAGDMTTITDSQGGFSLEAVYPTQITFQKPGWATSSVDWNGSSGPVVTELALLRIRGLRVGAGAAGDDASFDHLLALAEQSAVNALVFDSKQEGGKVLYDTTVTDAYELGAVEAFYDPNQRIAQAHDQGLYTIARVVIFEDSIRVKARPEEKLAGRWIDPRAESAWQYNIDLASEACELGFDEIQFDYVRFPAGATARVSGQLDLTPEERLSAIEGFLEAAREVLIPMGCAMSADIFAIVVSVPDDQGLGQRPEELSRQLDAISPMVYPSHYSLGWLGFPDPNDHPYEVTADAIDDALPRLDPGTALRPWLQGFWWTNAQIRSSIQAAEDRDVGWILWNARSNFDLAALPTDAEVDD